APKLHDRALATACEDALTQIHKKDYACALKEEGISPIYGLGLAFAGKRCLIKASGDLSGETGQR
ncbi:MAG: hypothetical protein IJ228_05305, partial [Succinivibrio sp.]|nr:hypothetical protein [Succinivibrio sp.]